MLRNLHTKLMLVLVLLMIAIMAVTGTFLINGIGTYHLSEFTSQMATAFSQSSELVSDLRAAARSGNGAEALSDVLRAYSGTLGVDLYSRNYYVLDGKTGAFLTGSGEASPEFAFAPNILTALSGEVGDARTVTGTFMDVAVPIDGGDTSYIVYIRDSKLRASELTSELFVIITESLFFGLAISVVLAFLLSKTITTPIEWLTRSAERLASGRYEGRIESSAADEIGVLTETFNDMAERLETTLETMQSERNKLETLFLRMTDGVCAFAMSGEITQINPAAQKMLALEDSDWSGKRYDDLFGQQLSWETALAIRAGGCAECDIERDGLILRAYIAPFGDGADAGIMAVVHDVTEQTKLENSRREFVANVSHELRTPLTNVKSYAETLYDTDDLDRDTERNFLGVIIGESDRMTHIVSDLLTLSRLDHDRGAKNFELHDLSAIAQKVCLAMELSAKERGHDLSLDLSDQPGLVMCDVNRIEQVLVNILSNAIKYTPDGGKIEMRVYSEPGYACVSVSDNGIGIPQDSLDRIFERFYRVDKARSRAAGGSGLGLSIAKDIVDLHSGELKISSREGVGTTVFVRLPVAQSEK